MRRRSVARSANRNGLWNLCGCDRQRLFFAAEVAVSP
jgi:hypothetical protein